MTGWVGRAGLGMAGLGLVAGQSLGESILASRSTGWGDSVCGAVPVGSALPDGGRLAPGQVANASIIISVAGQKGVGIRGAVDAVTAAQDVERSGHPKAYDRWVQPATSLVAGLTGAGQCSNGSSGSAGAAIVTALPAGFSLPAGMPAPVRTAIGYAVAQLGKPYVWGGTGPSGFDCSGLVMMAYRAAGISLPRTTYEQVYAGQPVYDTGTLAPGDLIFTEGSDPGPGGAPGHVGMYIGDALVIDAPYTGRDIELTPLAFWSSQIVAVREVIMP